MGKQQRTLDPVWKVHEAFFDLAGKTADCIILENVTEYREFKQELGPSWEVTSARIDPRHFGFGAARPRLYAVCFRRDRLQWNPCPSMSLHSLLSCLLARPNMKAEDFYWQDLPQAKLTASEESWLHFGTLFVCTFSAQITKLNDENISDQESNGRFPTAVQ